MEIVVDAQIVKAYFMEKVIEIYPDNLTESADRIFSRLGEDDRMYLDEEGHIEQEWRQLVSPEWFNGWFSALLMADAARTLPVKRYPCIRKSLEREGFPTKGPGGRDLWYVRTAKSVVDKATDDLLFCYIVSEDIDFHRPDLKGLVRGKERVQILRESTSPVKNVLEKENILVRCIASYLPNY